MGQVVSCSTLWGMRICMADLSQEDVIKDLIKRHGFNSERINGFLEKSGDDFDMRSLTAELGNIQRDAVKATILRESIENENLIPSLHATSEEMMERHAGKLSNGLNEVAHLDRSALERNV